MWAFAATTSAASVGCPDNSTDERAIMKSTALVGISGTVLKTVFPA
jgi:hypothetical protein